MTWRLRFDSAPSAHTGLPTKRSPAWPGWEASYCWLAVTLTPSASEAVPLAEEAVAIRQKRLAKGHRQIAEARAVLADAIR